MGMLCFSCLLYDICDINVELGNNQIKAYDIFNVKPSYQNLYKNNMPIWFLKKSCLYSLNKSSTFFSAEKMAAVFFMFYKQQEY